LDSEAGSIGLILYGIQVLYGTIQNILIGGRVNMPQQAMGRQSGFSNRRSMSPVNTTFMSGMAGGEYIHRVARKLAMFPAG
jgi:hypothetical protein